MTLAPDEDEIRRVWSSYWGSLDEVAAWDSLSETILLTIERESRLLGGSRVMEAGCGTGRISHRLALAGFEVTCLDITPEALDLAEGVFGATSGRFVRASILDVPRDQNYDLVWNAGVLEHFTPEDQRKALGEFVSVLSPGGRVVILTPYSRSLLYRIGKVVAEALGRWPYGVEIPKRSLSDILPSGGVLEREYTVCFLPLIFDAYKFIAPLRRPLRWLWHKLLRRFGAQRLAQWDLALSRLLGGYLLVSVLRRA
jgi:2-polyprenyl-3-methyl-5-hydroxy-6-metoxy-1,4-benzoquinol methylase